MAKNVFEKKKRVARFRNLDGGIGCESMAPDCLDYVSSIMKTMDSSCPLSDLLKSSESRVTSLTEFNTNKVDPAIPSVSKDYLASTSNASKFKKFCSTRKFPLMEKSQKFLKQLKHNRKIPKQRAHLASISTSPKKRSISSGTLHKKSMQGIKKAKKNESSNKNSCDIYLNTSSSDGQVNMSCDKSNVKKIKNSQKEFDSSCSVSNDSVLRNSSKSKVPSKNISKISYSTSNAYLNDKDTNNFKKSKAPCKKNDKSDVGKHYGESYFRKDNLDCNRNDISDNASDSTDDEYERFIQSSKVGLQKKSKKKAAKSKAKVTKKPPRRVKKAVRKVSDTDFSDDTSSSVNYRGKKMKACHEKKGKSKSRIQVCDESEAEVDFMDGELYTRDTSSESDTAVENTIAKNPLVESTNKSNLSDATDCVESSSGECLNGKFVLDSEINIPSSSKSIIKVGVNKESENVSLECTSSPELVEVIENSEESELVAVIENSEESELAAVIENSEESELVAVIENSEESDLEIVDVVLPPSVKRETVHDEANNKISHSKDEIEKDPSTDVIENIKIQNVYSLHNAYQAMQTSDAEIKPETENESRKKDQCTYKTQVVYATNASEETDSKHSLKQLHLHSIVNTPSSHTPHTFRNTLCERGSTHPISNVIVKKEDSDDDDDVIILELDNQPPREKSKVKRESPDIFIDYVSKDKICSVDKNSAVKIESCCTSPAGNQKTDLKDLKLYNSPPKEPSNSVTELIPSKQGQEFNNLGHNVDMKHLLELFKREFQTYQEIVQTEANVEASLKLLETKQAERLTYIRSLIQNSMGNKQSDKDYSNSEFKETVDKLCKDKDLNLETAETKHFLTPDDSSKVILENFKVLFSKEKLNLPQNVLPKYCTSSQNTLSSGDKKIDLSCCSGETSPKFVSSHLLMKPKLEPVAIQELPNTYEKITKQLLKEKCNACGKEAVGACERCAKVFFCSNECGKKYWVDVHENECGK